MSSISSKILYNFRMVYYLHIEECSSTFNFQYIYLKYLNLCTQYLFRRSLLEKGHGCTSIMWIVCKFFFRYRKIDKSATRLAIKFSKEFIDEFCIINLCGLWNLREHLVCIEKCLSWFWRLNLPLAQASANVTHLRDIFGKDHLCIFKITYFFLEN